MAEAEPNQQTDSGAPVDAVTAKHSGLSRLLRFGALPAIALALVAVLLGGYAWRQSAQNQQELLTYREGLLGMDEAVAGE